MGHNTILFYYARADHRFIVITSLRYFTCSAYNIIAFLQVSKDSTGSYTQILLMARVTINCCALCNNFACNITNTNKTSYYTHSLARACSTCCLCVLTYRVRFFKGTQTQQNSPSSFFQAFVSRLHMQSLRVGHARCQNWLTV